MNSRQNGALRPGRAIVIGGSLGGLFAATLLHQQGWLADVYERSPHDLDSRGGGIVLQPEVVEAFRRAKVRYDVTIGVEAKERIFLDQAGGIAQRIPMRQMLTSWTLLYAALRRRFPAEHYHQGAEFVAFDQTSDAVTARFADGREATGDLLVAADGGGSTARRILVPEVKPNYAGYVAWRGLVDEGDLAPEAAAVLAERFAFFEYPNSHILAYLVPGENEAIEPGQRRFNWVWYRNVAEARTAASTLKAAGNVLALADALATAQDVPEALTLWEPEQLRIGWYLRRHGQELGNRSQKAYPADTERTGSQAFGNPALR